MVFGLGNFNGHEGFDGKNGIGKRNAEGRMLLEFCDERELCVANTWFMKMDKTNITFKSGNNESKIDFISVSKENKKHLNDVKVIPWKLQDRLLVANVKHMSKAYGSEIKRVKRMVWKLKDRECKKNLKEELKS